MTAKKEIVFLLVSLVTLVFLKVSADGGPCPPGGTHRYFFKLYALDVELAQEPGLTKAKLIEAMKGHILAEGQLMGRYKR